MVVETVVAIHATSVECSGTILLRSGRKGRVDYMSICYINITQLFTTRSLKVH